jgi:DNA processing protein
MIYWVWLSSLTRVSPKKCKKLIDYFGDPESIWNAKQEELKSLSFITRTNFEELVDIKKKQNCEKILNTINRLGIKVITIKDEIYPSFLKNIYDPPTVLYMRGSIDECEKFIAVVGSRNATSYGRRAAENISSDLSRYGITVASGMARGIDSYAHRGALKFGGRTVAVLGCGVDIVYPPENETLMEKIISSGAVISEFAPGTLPIPRNFPLRNRIISGMSLGVVVVEAGEKSGSLITVDQALEQGREVFAVPGNINSINSSGTNKLIKDGAKIITSVDDILEEIRIFLNTDNNYCVSNKIDDRYIFFGLDSDEKKIVECLMREPMHIDLLAQTCGLSSQAASALLVMMELKGVVEQTPGKIFTLRN